MIYNDKKISKRLKNIFFVNLLVILLSVNFVSATNYDQALTSRLKGKLLLAVEDRGRIWYVNPTDGKKYEVTFANALPLFQKLSLGITNKDLDQISEVKSTVLGNRLKGKLLLQVEDRGRIWYIDSNGLKHEITWENLMSLFRRLSLGITNQNLDKIENGKIQLISNWNTYTNSNYKFEIEYPNNWNILQGSYLTSSFNISFGDGLYGTGEYDGDWFVFVYDKSIKSKETLINEMGKQFHDRQIIREDIKINGIFATKVIVTSASAPSLWKYEVVLIENNNNIYFISNGAKDNYLFNNFYNSFKFTWQTYANTKYRFSITFPMYWNDYTSEEMSHSLGLASFAFGMVNQREMFIVTVFTKEQWQNFSNELGPKPTFITESNQYIFAYSKSDNYADEYKNLASDILDIINTFKLN